jgi:hypothetical protein
MGKENRMVAKRTKYKKFIEENYNKLSEIPTYIWETASEYVREKSKPRKRCGKTRAIHCKKKVSDIPVPSRVTYQTLPGRYNKLSEIPTYI